MVEGMREEGWWYIWQLKFALPWLPPPVAPPLPLPKKTPFSHIIFGLGTQKINDGKGDGGREDLMCEL